MHLSRLYDQVFVIYILQMFSEDIMSGLVDIISVFSFSPHVKQVKGNCSHCIFYRPSKFRQSSSQWSYVHSILNVPPTEKIKGSKVRSLETCDLRSRHFLVEMWRHSILLEQHVMGILFKNSYEDFLLRV
jgi:hypothetical protein